MTLRQVLWWFAIIKLILTILRKFKMDKFYFVYWRCLNNLLIYFVSRSTVVVEPWTSPSIKTLDHLSHLTWKFSNNLSLLSSKNLTRQTWGHLLAKLISIKSLLCFELLLIKCSHATHLISTHFALCLHSRAWSYFVHSRDLPSFRNTMAYYAEKRPHNAAHASVKKWTVENCKTWSITHSSRTPRV